MAALVGLSLLACSGGPGGSDDGGMHGSHDSTGGSSSDTGPNDGGGTDSESVDTGSPDQDAVSCRERDSYEEEETSCDGKDNDCDGFVDGLHLGCHGYAKFLSTSEDENGKSLEFDSEGRLYLGGWTDGRDTFAERQGYWARYEPSGTGEKFVPFGSLEFDNIYDLAIGPNGEVVLVGESFGDFADQTYSGGDNDDGDFTIVKFDASGERQWVRLLGTTEGEQARGVAIDGAGNIYVAGETKGELGNDQLGGPDAALVKYSPTGQRQWVTQFGTPDHEDVDDLTLDSQGNLYVIGESSGEFSGKNHQGDWDGYMARFTPQGQRTWLEIWTTPAFDGTTGVASDGSGSLYVTGETEGDLDGRANAGGGGDGYLSKVSTDGSVQWTRLAGTPETDYADGVDVGPDGDVYVVANSEGDLGDEPHVGDWDGIVAKYTPMGDQVWAHTVATVDEERVTDVAVSAEGRVAVAGHTKGDLDGNGAGSDFDAFVLW